AGVAARQHPPPRPQVHLARPASEGHGRGTTGRSFPAVPGRQTPGRRVADRTGQSSALLAVDSNTSSLFPSASVIDWEAVLCPLASTPSSSLAAVSHTYKTEPSRSH